MPVLFFTQNYTLQREDDVTDKPFEDESDHQNTRDFRSFKVLSAIFYLILAFGLCFEHYVLSISKFKAVW